MLHDPNARACPRCGATGADLGEYGICVPCEEETNSERYDCQQAVFEAETRGDRAQLIVALRAELARRQRTHENTRWIAHQLAELGD